MRRTKNVKKRTRLNSMVLHRTDGPIAPSARASHSPPRRCSSPRRRARTRTVVFGDNGTDGADGVPRRQTRTGELHPAP
jgi:hypothetical protein